MSTLVCGTTTKPIHSHVISAEAIFFLILYFATHSLTSNEPQNFSLTRVLLEIVLDPSTSASQNDRTVFKWLVETINWVLWAALCVTNFTRVNRSWWLNGCAYRDAFWKGDMNQENVVKLKSIVFMVWKKIRCNFYKFISLPTIISFEFLYLEKNILKSLIFTLKFMICMFIRKMNSLLNLKQITSIKLTCDWWRKTNKKLVKNHISQ